VNTLLSLFLVAQTSVAQPPPPSSAQPPSPAADPLQSPEVHPDRRITFRLRAPRATEVAVAGEWMRPGGAVNAPQKLTRNAEGVWSVTVGPVDPNIYIYVFQVDGMTISDPLNPLIKLRARTSASMVEVPGSMPWEARDVPHGAVEINTHTSKVLQGATRQIFVYTPPGYDKNRSQRYPILYLFHGNNDLAAGWTMAGRANLVLDNQIAEKKTVPMIVVMPWGHALPFGARPAAGQPTNNDLFGQYLINDVMPLIESRYRVAPGRARRAIVGLSMGGTQALQIGLAHRDLFATIGLFGAGLTRADFDTRFGKTLAEPASPRTKLNLVFVGIAREDAAHARAKELTEALRSHNLPVRYHETEGGHTYPVWRKLLVETLPLLFQPTTPARG
jgi:enterochelin esterase-like enzyme